MFDMFGICQLFLVNADLFAAESLKALEDINTNHSYSLYGFSQSLQEH